MVCSARLRMSSRDKEGPSDFLAFSNFNYKKFKKFVHFLDLVQVIWYRVHFTVCVMKAFVQSGFLKVSVFILSCAEM